MADLLRIGNDLVNLDQLTHASLDKLTSRNQRCVQMRFSDGREITLDYDYSIKFRVFVDAYVTEGIIDDVDLPAGGVEPSNNGEHE